MRICGFVVDTSCQFVVLDRNVDIEKSGLRDFPCEFEGRMAQPKTDFHPHGKSLKPQSLFSISTFLSKTTNWQLVSTTNPQIRTVTYCTRLPTHLTLKTQFRTPNFSDSVGSAAKIQTLTPNATKCRISFPNVAILTASCPKHSIVSKTSIENPL